jgi:acyl-CoA synthetase (AMP-forming)/AMP-acid ligase II
LAGRDDGVAPGIANGGIGEAGYHYCIFEQTGLFFFELPPPGTSSHCNGIRVPMIESVPSSQRDLRGAPAPLHEQVREHARVSPGKVALIWYGREITYAELDRLSDACAVVLARVGVEQGEPVALFMQNCPQFVIAFLGIQKLGAIVSPCSPLFKRHELAYQLGDLGARVVIAADTLYPVIDQVRQESALRSVLLVHYQDMLPAQPTYAVPQEIRHAAWRLRVRPTCSRRSRA